MIIRRFPLTPTGLASALVILVFILSACAGGSAPASSASGSNSGSGPAPVASAGGSGSASASGGNGDCTNPLMPVVAGASWNYSYSSGAVSMTIAQSIPSVSAGGFTKQVVYQMTGVDDTTQTGQWKCDRGALTDINPLSSDYGYPNPKTTYQITSMVGPSLPASAKPGDSWSQTYTVLTTSTAGSAPSQGSENVSESCNVIGTESVNVTAGTFDAMHITCKTSTSTVIDSTSQSAPSLYTSQTDDWYAANIGLVKTNDQFSINQGKTNSSVLELTAYKK